MSVSAPALNITARLCFDAQNKPVPWANEIFDPELREETLRYGRSFKNSNGQDTEAGAAFIRGEISAAKIIGDHIIESYVITGSADPIPLVWIPDGGLLAHNGIRQAFEEAEVPTTSFTCANYNENRKHRLALRRETVIAAGRAGYLFIVDETINSGDTIYPLINSVPSDYKGKIIIVASRLYRESALNNASGNTFLPFITSQLPKRAISLYTANAGAGKDIDPVKISDAIKTLAKSSGNPEIRELSNSLPKRGPENIR